MLKEGRPDVVAGTPERRSASSAISESKGGGSRVALRRVKTRDVPQPVRELCHLEPSATHVALKAVTPGSFAFGPKGVPHTFIAETDGARMLIGLQPVQFEGFLREIGEPAPERVPPPRPETPPNMELLLPIAERMGRQRAVRARDGSEP